MENIVKTSAPGGQDLRDEVAALRWLGQAEKNGGLHAAHVECVTPTRLTEERITQTSMTPARAEAIGRALAHTHATGAPWFGAPPPGFVSDGYRIQDTLTRVVAKESDASSSWGAYYAQVRIKPFVKKLVERRLFDKRAEALFKEVCGRLEAGDFDAPQPKLVATQGRVARVHGDLWAGNLLVDANPANTSGATLIDPMAHGDHAESDLAMLALFGYPQLDRVIAAYNEESALADGWRERVHLHQLAPLLHHCLLFGASYVQETLFSAGLYA